MSTLFQFDGMLPAVDAEAKDKLGDKRQVEVFTSSSASPKKRIYIRIGPLNSEHSGDGYCVEVDGHNAEKLHDALGKAIAYLGYKAT